MRGIEQYNKIILNMLKCDYKQYDRDCIAAGKLGNLDDCKEWGAVADYIEELIERIKPIK